MKRISLVLAVLLVFLAGCGQAEAPTIATTFAATTATATAQTTAKATTAAATTATPVVSTAKRMPTTAKAPATAVTTAPFAEPVIVSVVEQGWVGGIAEQPEPIHLGVQGVDKGSTVEYNPKSFGSLYHVAITIKALDDDSVTVHFQSNGLVEDHSAPSKSTRLQTVRDGWAEKIPYGEEYVITTSSVDAGFYLKYTFTKNPQ